MPPVRFDDDVDGQTAAWSVSTHPLVSPANIAFSSRPSRVASSGLLAGEVVLLGRVRRQIIQLDRIFAQLLDQLPAAVDERAPVVVPRGRRQHLGVDAARGAAARRGCAPSSERPCIVGGRGALTRSHSVGAEIEQRDVAVDDARRDAGDADHERHAQELVVERLAVEVHALAAEAVLAERLAVVAEDDDRGVLRRGPSPRARRASRRCTCRRTRPRRRTSPRAP